MLDQIVTEERCRWQTGFGQCTRMTNHVYQTETPNGVKVEFPCCVPHQQDASFIFEQHKDDMKYEEGVVRRVRETEEPEEEQEARIIVIGGAREIYDEHRTEKPTSYLFTPSAKSRKTIARVSKMVKSALTADPELAKLLLALSPS